MKRRQPTERAFGPQLVIDDQKEMAPKDLVHRGPVTYARTFDEAKYKLFEAVAGRRPPWDVVYMDHDLGDEDPKHTGMELLKWLLRYSRPERLPRVVKVITMNAPALLPMHRVADAIMERRTAKGEAK